MRWDCRVHAAGRMGDNTVRATSIAILVRVAMLGAVLALAPSGAGAQGYPNKPIRIICSFPPGGGTDFLARLVGQKLSERWGQPVIVDNRPGGNGTIGGRAVMTAEPDGYTLWVGSSDHVISAPNLFGNLPYDTLKDFVPIVSIGYQYVILVVHPGVPARTAADFVALAKAKPGQINYASAGNGTVNHLGGELFQLAAGVKLTHIPYKGSGPAIAALLSGQDVNVSFASTATIVPHIKAGSVRALAISAPRRSAALPDVPTGAEVGYADFLIYSWNGVFAPVGTPREIVAKINAEVVDILRAPDVIERLASVGVDPSGGTPEQFASSIRSDLAKWAKMIRESGIEKKPL